MSMNDTKTKRLYRVKSYYKSDPTVYYVVASGSTAAEEEVLAHEDCAGDTPGYFCTEQVAEYQADPLSPLPSLPHALLFQYGGTWPEELVEEPVRTPEDKKKLLAALSVDDLLEEIKWRREAPVAP